jgi:hypothetical protein
MAQEFAAQVHIDELFPHCSARCQDLAERIEGQAGKSLVGVIPFPRAGDLSPWTSRSLSLRGMDDLSADLSLDAAENDAVCGGK